MPREALDIRSMLLVEFPPGALVAIGTRDGEEKVVRLELIEKLIRFRIGWRFG
jgi:hypothetical protein